jgi:biotin carboxyl carrier protein
MELEFEIADHRRGLTLDKKGTGFSIDLGRGGIDVECQVISPNIYLLTTDNGPTRVYLAHADGTFHVLIGGEKYLVQEASTGSDNRVAHESGPTTASGKICAPMPGKILKILVSQGMSVEKNQSLAILEAMKMEHDIRSPIAGLVRKVNFSPDDLIDTGQPIIELQPDET